MNPQLSKALLDSHTLPSGILVPKKNWEHLPEKVLQFGTGVLLRGLPDYFIDKANKQGIFNGRIVVVKSTNQGNTDEFSKQDGLYTIHNKGIQAGKEIQETIIVSAISRVLSASEQWDEILKAATLPNLTVVISNTTEQGIAMNNTENLNASPPTSFPGKLTAVLYQRFHHFAGDVNKGLIILPTELISDNGNKLKEIVTELAKRRGLEKNFITWLTTANHFCNTLVDRIVPGKLSFIESEEAESKLKYSDKLAIKTEPFRLWAIESNSEHVAETLSFAKVDKGMVITSSIWKYKELKLRLLNGSHTFSCGLAVLCGFESVKKAMENENFSQYVRSLMRNEIIPSIIADNLSKEEAVDFSESVIDRFKNPFLDHRWLNICFNYTLKMKLRNAILFQRYAEKLKAVPEDMALGFAAYLRFMKCTNDEKGNYIGTTGNESYQINDPDAELYLSLWKNNDADVLVEKVLQNESLWGVRLNQIPGLRQRIQYYLKLLLEQNPIEILEQMGKIGNGGVSK